MAFRRQRIKAFANVALRRNKDAPEEKEAVELLKENESKVQFKETSKEKIDIKCESDSVNTSEYNSVVKIEITDASDDKCSGNSRHTTNVPESKTPDISNSSVSDVENVKANSNNNISSYVRCDHNNVVLPIRKRIRPAVSVLSVNRKIKDAIIDKETSDDKSLSTTTVKLEVLDISSFKEETSALCSSNVNCDNTKVSTCGRISGNTLLSNFYFSTSKKNDKSDDSLKYNDKKFSNNGNCDDKCSNDQLLHDNKRINLLHNCLDRTDLTKTSEKSDYPCSSDDKIDSSDILSCTAKTNCFDGRDKTSSEINFEDVSINGVNEFHTNINNSDEILDVTDFSSESANDIVVGIPISDCSIPTGTSVRHRQSSCPNNTSSYDINDNARSIPEADVPIECAVTEDCGLAKIPPAPTNAYSKPRLHRPVPKIQANRSRCPKSVTDLVTSEKNIICASASSIIVSLQESVSEDVIEEGTANEQSERNCEEISNLVSTKSHNQSQKDQQVSASNTLENDGKPSILYQKLKTRQKSTKVKTKNTEKKKNVLSKSKKSAKTLDDKTKISIFDLVFSHYKENDPLSTTPSMQQQQQQPSQSDAQQSNDLEQHLEEEAVDDVIPNENMAEEQSKENEDEGTAVPQVKLDADGNIIVDTDSLVVETTAAKKSREVLKNASIIIDTGSSSYHMYSKKKRLKTRDWSPQETLRFFHALRAVGTDFSMMQTLFPHRTRVELKSKFKKEERTNSDLITEAFNKPFAFDFEQLERECEKDKLEEQKIREQVQQEYEMKERNKEKKKALANEKIKNKKKVKKSYAMHCFDELHNDSAVRNNRRNDKEDMMIRKKRKELFEKLKKNSEFREIQKSFIGDESDAECESSDISYTSDVSSDEGKKRKRKVKEKNVKHSELNDSEDEEVKGIQRELMYLQKVANPTRSGRIPKKSFVNENESINIELIGKRYSILANKENCLDPNEKENCENAESNNVCDKMSLMPCVSNSLRITNPSFEKLQPGSLLVLSAPSPDNPGHQLYKFFMVAPSDASPLSENNTNSAAETSNDHENIITENITDEPDI